MKRITILCLAFACLPLVVRGADSSPHKHWAFVPPTRPDLPLVRNAHWTRNPIDHFVLARLEREGLSPSPEADRTTLIRRVTLDLTGLPPTPQEVDAFLADKSAEAYEKVVDRLLASPRYGERMARPWLDAARYADTNGYQTDGERFMWRWRDWVIDAFNKNMPYDQFTIEQIAGDMLPNATLDQRIATGFNRNHRLNGEGGIIPEEYAVEYVVDRVETTSTVWLGMTIGCARCHDHKFDPISQKEFYQLFAYFNNVPEQGRAIKHGNSPPLIKAPTAEQEQRLGDLDHRLAAVEKRFTELQPQVAIAQEDWERSLSLVSAAPSHRSPQRKQGKVGSTKPLLAPRADEGWSVSRDLLVHHKLDGNLKAIGKKIPPSQFRDGKPRFVSGRLGQAASCDGKRYIDAGDVANFGFYDKFSCAAWIYPTNDKGGTILSRMVDAEQADGYYLVLQDGKIQVNLIKRWLDDAIRVEMEERLAADRWHHVMMTYDGSRWASGVAVYINGQPTKLKVSLDELNQSFATKEPLRIGGGNGPDGRFHGYIDDARIYGDALTAEEARIVATPETIGEIAAIPAGQRTKSQAAKLRAYFLEKHTPRDIKQTCDQLAKIRRERQNLWEAIPTTMVMEEMESPRDTVLLLRGQYDRRGPKVGRGIPAVLGSGSRPSSRLDFARWLVHPSNPLTARVAVNRFWQLYFGTGLVKAAEDFGIQGEQPSHPDLLDWLATEFMRSGWNVKALQKRIVMSATYGQSSRATPPLFQKDPENRLLARGPRFRLPAEMLRDQALAISGLLVEKPGGPSVKPYQPPGLWKELTGVDDYEQDRGEKLYRRSLYTFWKRTVPPPAMTAFDATARETCVVRETRTNTPLQSLNLMNDVTYVEAARLVAERMLKEGGRTPDQRITFAFRLATARRPRPSEFTVLLDGFRQYSSQYTADRKSAEKLLSMGESPRDKTLDASELAAYTAIAGVIMNLDEVLTKE